MRLTFTILGSTVVAIAACGLNPQPLPPDSPMDAGSGIATPTVGDSGHGFTEGDTGTKVGGPPGIDAGGVGGIPDGGEQASDDSGFDATAGNGPDGGTSPDAGSDGGTAEAAVDAAPDAPPLDGSTDAGTPADGSAPVDGGV